jgi:pimeloyl-ACP methyl ester carboxylesterase
MNQSSSNSNQGNYIQVNSVNMYYASYGEGTPLILLHGGLETSQMWGPVVQVLSMHYQVITPDSRGHGRTTSSKEPVTYSLMAEDIVQLIEVLGLDRPFIAGYSDGGQIARYMAINYPGLARGYMIGAIFNTITAEWQGMMQVMLGIEGPGKVDTERVALQNPMIVQDLKARHNINREDDYWKTLLIQSSQRWWSPVKLTQSDYSKITEPTLFWCGDRDVFCPPEQALEMYRMVTGAELAVIPNADHFSMMQQIDIANMILSNFIDRVSGRQ